MNSAGRKKNLSDADLIFLFALCSVPIGSLQPEGDLVRRELYSFQMLGFISLSLSLYVFYG